MSTSGTTDNEKRDDEWLHPPRSAVADAVRRAVAEDLTPLGDLTASLLPAGRTSARIVARQEGTVAGSRCATEAFCLIDPEVSLDWSVPEGQNVGVGETLAIVEGPLRSVVTGERTALNFLGHLSGIATLTARFVRAAAAGGPARIWDTRKTTPGLRSLEKAAVRAGGGRNHRGNLSDWLLIKDNHLEGLSITEAVALAPRSLARPYRPRRVRHRRAVCRSVAGHRRRNPARQHGTRHGACLCGPGTRCLRRRSSAVAGGLRWRGPRYGRPVQRMWGGPDFGGRDHEFGPRARCRSRHLRLVESNRLRTGGFPRPSLT